MSIRGPEALASLDEAMRDIRREEDEISKRLARSAERVTKIRESEARAVPPAGAIAARPRHAGRTGRRAFRQAEIKARDMLKAHATELGQTEKALADIDARAWPS